MTLTEYLLLKLPEECDEVSQRTLKAVIFGIDEVQATGPSQQKTPETLLPNSERIRKEFADLMGVYEILVHMGLVKMPDRTDVNAKKLKVAKYLRHSMDLGIVDRNDEGLIQFFKYAQTFDTAQCPGCEGDLKYVHAPGSRYDHRTCPNCIADYFVNDDQQLIPNNQAAYEAMNSGARKHKRPTSV